MKKIISTFLSFAAVMAAQATVVTYPAGHGVVTLDDYSIAVRQGAGEWQPVDAYPVKLQHVQIKDGKVCNPTETASIAYFDFDGTVEVRVVANHAKVETTRIRPLSFSITPAVAGDTIYFTLDRPRNISVEVNGDIFKNLHLFANPIDSHRPTAREIKRAGKKGSSLIYFGPGKHTFPDGVLRVPSGKTVYVDGGAYVEGQLLVDSVRDVRIYGRGEIRPTGRGEGIYIKQARNIEADGVILSQIPVGGSDSVRITNVKSLTHYGWGDGMNIFASNNVSYNGVFCRNSDDCNTVYATRKGFVGGCKNILMENSTLWADVAHPIMIGLHGSATEIGPDAPADTISELTYRNLDILDQNELQKDYQGVFGISCGDNNIVRNVVFDNIRVEDIRCGQLVNIRIFFNKKYCQAPGMSVDNVLFRDITYTGQNASTSIIAGYDDSRMVSNITFENLTVNGVKITDDMPGKPKWYKAGDMCDFFIGEHVSNIVFK